jgi:hypothetical protein
MSHHERDISQLIRSRRMPRAFLMDSGVKYAMMTLYPRLLCSSTINCPDGPKECRDARSLSHFQQAPAPTSSSPGMGSEG